MGEGGFSADRLARMRDVMAGHVASGAVPGLVTLLSRRGETHVEALGVRTLGGGPMRRDTIFRVASMTKPVAAVAAMCLVEECLLRLDEPVDRLLPELADRQVLTSLDAPLDDTVPAVRPITLRDLLTFRMGFGIVLAPPDTYPVQTAMDELRLGQGAPVPPEPPEPDEWIRRFATLPLLHQTGTKWMYNTAADVLGVLIARAAGQPLETVLRERVLEPLGMTDTGFSVPAEKLDRLATSYRTGPDGMLDVYDPVEGSQWATPPAFPSAGGGLVSTVDDYLAFGRMMLDKGRVNGRRILSRPSVETMTTDQLTPEQKAVSGLYPGMFDSMGWGFGMSVDTRRSDLSAVPGRFGWAGGLGTTWYCDPSEDLVGILMSQRMFDGPGGNRIVSDFWTSAYQAIDD